MFLKLILLTLFYNLLQLNGLEINYDNSVIDFDFNDFDRLDRATERVSIPNRHLIFPGTKWCGAGNIAENDLDFGNYMEVDMCCQKHDYCPDIITGFETKYNLTNPNFFTRLSCNCDKQFHDCLKSIDTNEAKFLGHIYFTLLGTKCFRNYYPIAGCEKYTYIPKKKCVDYAFNYDKEKEYQWFDLPNF